MSQKTISRVSQLYLNRALKRCATVVVNPHPQFGIFRLCRHHTRRKKAACIIVQRFPASEIINTGPRCHRPAVVELPVNGAHAAASVTSPVFHAVPHRFRLQKLRNIEQTVKVLRVAVIAGNIEHDQSIGCTVFLMAFHHGRKNITVTWLCESLNGFAPGE